MNRRRVLLAEDDGLVSKSLSAFLSKRGHATASARNGAEALALLKSGFSPDFAVVDLMMPVMDGFRLLAMLSVRHPDLPVVVLTGLQQPEAERGIAALRLARPPTLLFKPVRAGALLDLVEASAPPAPCP